MRLNSPGVSCTNFPDLSVFSWFQILFVNTARSSIGIIHKNSRILSLCFFFLYISLYQISKLFCQTKLKPYGNAVVTRHEKQTSMSDMKIWWGIHVFYCAIDWHNSVKFSGKMQKLEALEMMPCTCPLYNKQPVILINYEHN